MNSPCSILFLALKVDFCQSTHLNRFHRRISTGKSSHVEFPFLFLLCFKLSDCVGRVTTVTVNCRVCGRGVHVFVVSVCVCHLNVLILKLDFWYGGTSLSIKVIGQGQGYFLENAIFATWT